MSGPPKFFQDDMDIGMFALGAATAFNPIGAAMFGVDVLMRSVEYGKELAEYRRQQMEEKYAAQWEADALRREDQLKRSQKHFAKYQAATEMAEIRRLAHPEELLEEEDITRNREDQFINEQIGRHRLGSYRSQYEQNMIRNNMALQASRQAAISQQARQKLSGLRAQTDAARSDAAERAAVMQRQREEYMTALEVKKNAQRQQAQNIQDNLARSEEILNTQQELIQQNNLANQRAQEQAAAVAASRQPQPTATRAPIRTARRLPPSVALPKY
jgi:hypothetical protein